VQQKDHSTQPNSSRPNPQQSYSNSAPQCQICGRTGHIAVKCWYWYDYSYDTNENLTKAFAATTVSDPYGSDTIKKIRAIDLGMTKSYSKT
jgi:hypothetical protein